MNLDFLGDSLDHWKGSLFESLQSARLLNDFAIEPMASDLEKWTSHDFGLYARLLHVCRNQVLEHTVSLRQRRDYFAELSHTGDLFIDPDIGVATDKQQKPDEQHVRLQEVKQLLDTNPDRVLLIYQHVRGNVRERVDSVLRAIRSHIECLRWSTYESRTVAMLFLAHRSSRPAAIASHFTELLGRHAAKRVNKP